MFLYSTKFGYWTVLEHMSAFKHVYLLLKARFNLIITGDFNLPTVTWSSNINSSALNAGCSNSLPSQFFHELSNLGLFQINSVLNIKSRILDLIFTNEDPLFWLSLKITTIVRLKFVLIISPVVRWTASGYIHTRFYSKKTNVVKLG